jgi:uncharacterized protein YndB with AHSA1/START domain
MWTSGHPRERAGKILRSQSEIFGTGCSLDRTLSRILDQQVRRTGNVSKTISSPGKDCPADETSSDHQNKKTELNLNIMETTPFIIERTFDAPIAKVWKAITDKNDMKQWYFDIAEFKPEVGFEFQFEAEDKKMKYIHLCKVTEVIPNRKLTYSWRYQGYTGNSFVTFELFPEGKKTRLKLTHTGLETFPGIPEFAKENFVTGWNSLIGTSLDDYLKKVARNN